MQEHHDPFQALRAFAPGPGLTGTCFSVPRLAEAGLGTVARLPVCLRVVLESLLRNLDGQRVHEADVRRLAAWRPAGPRSAEIPFVVARILLQDFTGVPVLVDLAAMRAAVTRLGRDPALVEPLVPIDLVIDHSVQVDYWRSADALDLNMALELKRNRQRYQFLKWGARAFQGFNVVPPGVGICHQVNLERLAPGVHECGGLYHPDTLVGTDSHTTMINGLGVLGWGVGGIEAEAAMLGQPVYVLEPDVIGVHLTGHLRPGATATDLALHVTETLRRYRVVGKFVEFFGDGAAALTVPDRATLGNMAPEYGATCGFFAPDEQTCRYLAATGRPAARVDACRAYYRAQGMFGTPRRGDIDYTDVVEVNLGAVVPSVAGPRRPQDRIDLPQVGAEFRRLLVAPVADGGYARPPGAGRRVVRTIAAAVTRLAGGGDQTPETAPVELAPQTSDRDTNPLTEREMMQNRPTPDRVEEMPPDEFPRAQADLRDGDIVIAAITSCTNTSNPAVMLAAGIVACKAVARGLAVRPTVKTSLAPGSRVVAEYLRRAGLREPLDRLGFRVVAFGCTTCIGSSGPLDPAVERAIAEHGLVVAAVLSGNRNFEARVHQSVRANFLASPPLVVAFALAGRIDIDLEAEPLGRGADGGDVFLRDLWPTGEELAAALAEAGTAEDYRRLYADVESLNPSWADVPAPDGAAYEWEPASTYIQEPPYFDRFALVPQPPRPIQNARALAIFGDSLTTDHISPAGAITPDSPAGAYLLEHGVPPEDFNTYGARRGNDRVMVRGTFANVRLRNRMVPGVEGGFTAHQPGGEVLSIYEASLRYQAARVPLLVFAGQEYGTGSSRDWAAKGTALLGVRAVVARGFERIHRSNLVQMGVLPCQFAPGVGPDTLGLDGTETFNLEGLCADLTPGRPLDLVVRPAGREPFAVPVVLRLDTPIEAEYCRHGGILPYVLRRSLGAAAPGGAR